MMYIKPKLDILPEAQQEIWPMLKGVPGDFVLYGGTAVALRYGHRESIDFDFFSSRNDPDVKATIDQLPFVKKFAIEAGQATTKFGSQVIYMLKMSNGQEVEMAFMRHEQLLGGAINKPHRTRDNGIKIATPLDLMATKINALKNREKVKDFIDISIMIQNGVSFSRGFAAAMALQREYLAHDIEFYKYICERLTEPGYITEAFEKDLDAPKELLVCLPETIKVISGAAEKLSITKLLAICKKIIVTKDFAFEERRR